jgi:hypothetical protein
MLNIKPLQKFFMQAPPPNRLHQFVDDAVSMVSKSCSSSEKYWAELWSCAAAVDEWEASPSPAAESAAARRAVLARHVGFSTPLPAETNL